jgi:hypothetical protein
MFVGHYGIGLAGRSATRRASLGTWFLAVQFLDLLWPIFLLLGWEHVRVAPGITRLTPLDFYDYPISHSLAGALVWSALFALIYGLWGGRRGALSPASPAVPDRALPATAPAGAAFRGGRWRTAGLLGLGVLSHWVLDLMVHRPDLPLLPRGPYAGFGLWNAPAVELPLEAALYLGGAFVYLRATRPLDAVGRYATWSLLLALPALWLVALTGPPPPDVRALAWTSLVLWLFVPWAWWCDRHRGPAGGPA